jgi:hypothetical protein
MTSFTLSRVHGLDAAFVIIVWNLGSGTLIAVLDGILDRQFSNGSLTPHSMKPVTAENQDVIIARGDEAIGPRAFPKDHTNHGGRNDPGQGPAQNVACVVGSDVDARECHQQSGRQEAQPETAHPVQQERRRDGKGRCRVIRGEREIAAARNQQISDATVVWAHPMDEEQDELIDGQPE